jgi:hypothetical protein
MQSERGARPVATLAKMSKAKALRGSRIFALGVDGDAEETACPSFVPSRCGAFAVVHVNMCSRVGSQHLISTDQPRLAAAVSQP